MTHFADDPNYQAVLQAFKDYYSCYKKLRLENISGKRPYKKFVTDNNGYTAPIDEKLDQLKAVVKEKLRELEGFSMPQGGADDSSSLDMVLKEALKEIREDEIIDLGDQMLRTGPGLGIVKEDAMAAFEHYKATMRDDRTILDLISERQKDFEKQYAASTLSDGLVSEGVSLKDVPEKVATIIQQGDAVLHGRMDVEDLFGESPARLQYYHDLFRIEGQLQAEVGQHAVGEISDINNLIASIDAGIKAQDPYHLSSHVSGLALPAAREGGRIDLKGLPSGQQVLHENNTSAVAAAGLCMAYLVRRICTNVSNLGRQMGSGC